MRDRYNGRHSSDKSDRYNEGIWVTRVTGTMKAFVWSDWWVQWKAIEWLDWRVSRKAFEWLDWWVPQHEWLDWRKRWKKIRPVCGHRLSPGTSRLRASLAIATNWKHCPMKEIEILPSWPQHKHFSAYVVLGLNKVGHPINNIYQLFKMYTARWNPMQKVSHV